MNYTCIHPEECSLHTHSNLNKVRILGFHADKELGRCLGVNRKRKYSFQHLKALCGNVLREWVLWHSKLSCGLQHSHPFLALWFETWIFYFLCGILMINPGNQKMIAQVLSPLPPTWEKKWSSGLLSLDGCIPACCGQLGQ